MKKPKLPSKLIEKERNWLQFRLAADHKGESICCWHDDAVQFCATGAVFNVLGELGNATPVGVEYFNRFSQIVGGPAKGGGVLAHIIEFNNAPRTTHTHVLAVMREVERQLKKEKVLV